MAKYKYYRRDYGKEKISKAKKRHNAIAQYNIKLLENILQLKNSYPYLYKIISRKINYLICFNDYSINKVIESMVNINGYYIFFGSCRYLSNYYKYGQYNTWNRNVNIFVTLGLINKHKADSLNRMVKRGAKRLSRGLSKKLKINIEKVQNINFYTIPFYGEDILGKSNSIAKTLLDNNFRTNGFSKIYLIKIFGKKFADNIFQDDRYVSQYSNYVSDEIEKFILNDIEQNGYTTKNYVLNNIDINYSKIINWEYGFLKGSKKAILEKEFDRNITLICKKHGLNYRKANKELLCRFRLFSYIYLICKI